MTLPFRGRWEEMNLLVQAFDRVERGEPQIILFEGEATIGTTALLTEFGEVARRVHRKLRLIRTGVEDASAGGYDPVACAAGALARGTLEYRLRANRMDAETRDLVVAWAEAILPPLQWATAIVHTVRRLQRRQTARLPRDPDVRSLLLAAHRTFVILLDDLHAVSGGGAAHLELLLRNVPRRFRLMVVGALHTATPNEPPRPIDRMLRTLPEGLVRRVRVGGLTEPEVQELVGARFPGYRVPEDFAARLVAMSGGHPHLLAGLVDAALAAGSLRPGAGRWEVYDTQATAEESIEVPELAALRPATSAVLSAASVIGTEFDGTTLARLIGADELEVEDHLATAARHGLIAVIGERELPDGDLTTLYRFESLPLRATLYRNVPFTQRRALEQALPGAAAATPS
jgi:predicted ATPase